VPWQTLTFLVTPLGTAAPQTGATVRTAAAPRKAAVGTSAAGLAREQVGGVRTMGGCGRGCKVLLGALCS